MSVFKVRGVGDELEVFDDKLTITPKGLLGVMSKGLKGTKTIPFTSITAVQHKKCGLTSGYLQFTLPGGNENRGGVFAAGSDENTFMYANKADNALVEQIKTYIEDRVKVLRAGPTTNSDSGIADQLAKLAELHKQGVLSVDEFAQAKQRLLAR